MKYQMSPKEVAEKEAIAINSKHQPFRAAICGQAIESERDLRYAVRRLIEQDREHVASTLPLSEAVRGNRYT